MPYADPEKQREQARNWYHQNKARYRERKAKYREENPERVKELQKARTERSFARRQRYQQRKIEESDAKGLCASCFIRPRIEGRRKCSVCAERQKRYQQKARTKLGNRWKSIRDKYGLTRDQWESMFAAQGCRCAICGRSDPGGKGAWHTDHDHATGQVRGILCHHCNTGVGHLGDNTEVMRRAIRYLRRFKPSKPKPVTASPQLTLISGGRLASGQ
jgi:hypothetical protein